MVHLNLHINKSEEHKRERGTVIIKENCFLWQKNEENQAKKTNRFLFLLPHPPSKGKALHSVLIIAGFIFNGCVSNSLNPD